MFFSVLRSVGGVPAHYIMKTKDYEIRVTSDGKVLIVQKDPAAIAVADIVEPNLADSIIEYNHHLLKNDIKAKQSILKRIADALEPKRNDLKQINRKIERWTAHFN